MASIAGRLGEYEISLNGCQTYNIVCIVDFTWNEDTEELEDTTHCNPCTRSYIPSFKSVTLSGNIVWDESNPGMLDMLRAYNGQNQIFKMRFRPSATSQFQFEGTAFITNFSLQSNRDDLTMFDFSARVNNSRLVANV